MAALQRFDRHVEHGKVVGHKKGIELATLQRLRHSFDVCQIEVGIWECSRIAPSSGMNTDGPHECPEMQLTCAHFAFPVASSSARNARAHDPLRMRAPRPGERSPNRPAAAR